MIIFKTPQFNDQQRIQYAISDNILEVTTFNLIEEELKEVVYFDLSTIEEGKPYIAHYPVISASRLEGVLKLEVLHFIGEGASEDERFPEWQDLEFEDFEIPEDAEIIQLEELVMPEPEPSPVDALARENEELKGQLQLLQTQTDFNKQNSDMMMMELIGMINSVI